MTTGGSTRPSTATNTRRRRWPARIGLAILALLATAAGAAGALEAVLGARDAGRHPALGTLQQVGDTTLHLHCTGRGTPSVLLEAGHGGDVTAWSWIQAELTPLARVCSYDRPGYGWSPYAEVDRDPVAAAQRARALLAAAGEPGPFVVVGHSLGGHLAQAFATLYPDEVAGVVLLDARHPSIPELVDGYRRMVDESLRTMRVGLRLAPFGVLRLVGDGSGELAQLPEEVRPAALSRLVRADHVRAALDELEAMDAADATVAALPPLGDTPLLVIEAGTPMVGFDEDFWRLLGPLQADLAGRASDGRVLRIEGADHVSLITRQDHAGRVAAAIASFLVSEVAAP